ncbi:MAG: hypothetical protein ACEPO8_03865 [Rhodothermaceae bacterium]
MAKLIRSIVLFLLLFTITNLGQNINVRLNVDPGISQLNLTSLIVDENLSGTPRVFRVVITPEQRNVIMEGQVFWKPVSGTFENVYSFKTKRFLSHTFTNQDLNNGQIKIDRQEENIDNDVLEELRKFGTITGTMRIKIKVTDVGTGQVAFDEEEIKFLNPAQTLSVRSPFPHSVEDVGGVMAEWDRVPGALSYKITLVQKKHKGQSLEDALTSGQPLIDKRDVGNKTKVNLRRLLEREWVPGMELVFQVEAVTAAPGGSVELKSTPTNFFLENPNDQSKDIIDPEELLDLIFRGEIKPDQIKRSMIDGRRIDVERLMRLINRLKANPNLIVNKRFLGKPGR